MLLKCAFTREKTRRGGEFREEVIEGRKWQSLCSQTWIWKKTNSSKLKRFTYPVYICIIFFRTFKCVEANMLDSHAQNTHPEQHDLREPRSWTQNPTYLLLCSVHWFLKAFGQDASSRANVAPNVGTLLFSLCHLHFWSAGTRAILLADVSALPSINWRFLGGVSREMGVKAKRGSVSFHLHKVNNR